MTAQLTAPTTRPTAPYRARRANYAPCRARRAS